MTQYERTLALVSTSTIHHKKEREMVGNCSEELMAAHAVLRLSRSSRGDAPAHSRGHKRLPAASMHNRPPK